MLSNTSFIAELVAFSASLLVYAKRMRHPAWMLWFPPYLLLTLLVEWAGYYVFKTKITSNNYWIYNVYVPLSVLFYLNLIYRYSTSYIKVKKWFYSTLVGYCIFAIVNLLFFQHMWVFATYNYITGGILISICCVLYFFELLNQRNRVSILSNPAFWLNTGLLLCYLPKTIFYTAMPFMNTISKAEIDLFYKFFAHINTTLIIILYSFISISFICKARLLN